MMEALVIDVPIGFCQQQIVSDTEFDGVSLTEDITLENNIDKSDSICEHSLEYFSDHLSSNNSKREDFYSASETTPKRSSSIIKPKSEDDGHPSFHTPKLFMSDSDDQMLTQLNIGKEQKLPQTSQNVIKSLARSESNNTEEEVSEMLAEVENELPLLHNGCEAETLTQPNLDDVYPSVLNQMQSKEVPTMANLSLEDDDDFKIISGPNVDEFIKHVKIILEGTMVKMHAHESFNLSSTPTELEHSIQALHSLAWKFVEETERDKLTELDRNTTNNVSNLMTAINASLLALEQIDDPFGVSDNVLNEIQSSVCFDLETLNNKNLRATEILDLLSDQIQNFTVVVNRQVAQVTEQRIIAVLQNTISTTLLHIKTLQQNCSKIKCFNINSIGPLFSMVQPLETILNEIALNEEVAIGDIKPNFKLKQMLTPPISSIAFSLDNLNKELKNEHSEDDADLKDIYDKINVSANQFMALASQGTEQNNLADCFISFTKPINDLCCHLRRIGRSTENIVSSDYGSDDKLLLDFETLFDELMMDIDTLMNNVNVVRDSVNNVNPLSSLLEPLQDMKIGLFQVNQVLLSNQTTSNMSYEVMSCFEHLSQQLVQLNNCIVNQSIVEETNKEMPFESSIKMMQNILFSDTIDDLGVNGILFGSVMKPLLQLQNLIVSKMASVESDLSFSDHTDVTGGASQSLSLSVSNNAQTVFDKAKRDTAEPPLIDKFSEESDKHNQLFQLGTSKSAENDSLLECASKNNLGIKRAFECDIGAAFKDEEPNIITVEDDRENSGFEALFDETDLETASDFIEDEYLDTNIHSNTESELFDVYRNEKTIDTEHDENVDTILKQILDSFDKNLQQDSIFNSSEKSADLFDEFQETLKNVSEITLDTKKELYEVEDNASKTNDLQENVLDYNINKLDTATSHKSLKKSLSYEEFKDSDNLTLEDELESPKVNPEIAQHRFEELKSDQCQSFDKKEVHESEINTLEFDTFNQVSEINHEVDTTDSDKSISNNTIISNNEVSENNLSTKKENILNTDISSNLKCQNTNLDSPLLENINAILQTDNTDNYSEILNSQNNECLEKKINESTTENFGNKIDPGESVVVDTTLLETEVVDNLISKVEDNEKSTNLDVSTLYVDESLIEDIDKQLMIEKKSIQPAHKQVETIKEDIEPSQIIEGDTQLGLSSYEGQTDSETILQSSLQDDSVSDLKEITCIKVEDTVNVRNENDEIIKGPNSLSNEDILNESKTTTLSLEDENNVIEKSGKQTKETNIVQKTNFVTELKEISVEDTIKDQNKLISCNEITDKNKSDAVELNEGDFRVSMLQNDDENTVLSDRSLVTSNNTQNLTTELNDTKDEGYNKQVISKIINDENLNLNNNNEVINEELLKNMDENLFSIDRDNLKNVDIENLTNSTILLTEEPNEQYKNKEDTDKNSIQTNTDKNVALSLNSIGVDNLTNEMNVVKDSAESENVINIERTSLTENRDNASFNIIPSDTQCLTQTNVLEVNEIVGKKDDDIQNISKDNVNEKLENYENKAVVLKFDKIIILNEVNDITEDIKEANYDEELSKNSDTELKAGIEDKCIHLVEPVCDIKEAIICENINETSKDACVFSPSTKNETLVTVYEESNAFVNNEVVVIETPKSIELCEYDENETKPSSVENLTLKNDDGNKGNLEHLKLDEEIKYSVAEVTDSIKEHVSDEFDNTEEKIAVEANDSQTVLKDKNIALTCNEITLVDSIGLLEKTTIDYNKANEIQCVELLNKSENQEIQILKNEEDSESQISDQTITNLVVSNDLSTLERLDEQETFNETQNVTNKEPNLEDNQQLYNNENVSINSEKSEEKIALKLEASDDTVNESCIDNSDTILKESKITIEEEQKVIGEINSSIINYLPTETNQTNDFDKDEQSLTEHKCLISLEENLALTNTEVVIADVTQIIDISRINLEKVKENYVTPNKQNVECQMVVVLENVDKLETNSIVQECENSIINVEESVMNKNRLESSETNVFEQDEPSKQQGKVLIEELKAIVIEELMAIDSTQPLKPLDIKHENVNEKIMDNLVDIIEITEPNVLNYSKNKTEKNIEEPKHNEQNTGEIHKTSDESKFNVTISKEDDTKENTSKQEDKNVEISPLELSIEPLKTKSDENIETNESDNLNLTPNESLHETDCNPVTAHQKEALETELQLDTLQSNDNEQSKIIVQNETNTNTLPITNLTKFSDLEKNAVFQNDNIPEDMLIDLNVEEKINALIVKPKLHSVEQMAANQTECIAFENASSLKHDDRYSTDSIFEHAQIEHELNIAAIGKIVIDYDSVNENVLNEITQNSISTNAMVGTVDNYSNQIVQKQIDVLEAPYTNQQAEKETNSFNNASTESIKLNESNNGEIVKTDNLNDQIENEQMKNSGTKMANNSSENLTTNNFSQVNVFSNQEHNEELESIDVNQIFEPLEISKNKIDSVEDAVQSPSKELTLDEVKNDDQNKKGKIIKSKIIQDKNDVTEVKRKPSSKSKKSSSPDISNNDTENTINKVTQKNADVIEEPNSKLLTEKENVLLIETKISSEIVKNNEMDIAQNSLKIKGDEKELQTSPVEENKNNSTKLAQEISVTEKDSKKIEIKRGSKKNKPNRQSSNEKLPSPEKSTEHVNEIHQQVEEKSKQNVDVAVIETISKTEQLDQPKNELPEEINDSQNPNKILKNTEIEQLLSDKSVKNTSNTLKELENNGQSKIKSQVSIENKSVSETDKNDIADNKKKTSPQPQKKKSQSPDKSKKINDSALSVDQKSKEETRLNSSTTNDESISITDKLSNQFNNQTSGEIKDKQKTSDIILTPVTENIDVLNDSKTIICKDDKTNSCVKDKLTHDSEKSDKIENITDNNQRNQGSKKKKISQQSQEKKSKSPDKLIKINDNEPKVDQQTEETIKSNKNDTLIQKTENVGSISNDNTISKDEEIIVSDKEKINYDAETFDKNKNIDNNNKNRGSKKKKTSSQSREIKSQSPEILKKINVDESIKQESCENTKTVDNTMKNKSTSTTSSLSSQLNVEKQEETNGKSSTEPVLIVSETDNAENMLNKSQSIISNNETLNDKNEKSENYSEICDKKSTNIENNKKDDNVRASKKEKTSQKSQVKKPLSPDKEKETSDSHNTIKEKITSDSEIVDKNKINNTSELSDYLKNEMQNKSKENQSLTQEIFNTDIQNVSKHEQVEVSDKEIKNKSEISDKIKISEENNIREQKNEVESNLKNIKTLSPEKSLSINDSPLNCHSKNNIVRNEKSTELGSSTEEKCNFENDTGIELKEGQNIKHGKIDSIPKQTDDKRPVDDKKVTHSVNSRRYLNEKALDMDELSDRVDDKSAISVLGSKESSENHTECRNTKRSGVDEWEAEENDLKIKSVSEKSDHEGGRKYSASAFDRTAYELGAERQRRDRTSDRETSGSRFTDAAADRRWNEKRALSEDVPLASDRRISRPRIVFGPSPSTSDDLTTRRDCDSGRSSFRRYLDVTDAYKSYSPTKPVAYRSLTPERRFVDPARYSCSSDREIGTYHSSRSSSPYSTSSTRPNADRFYSLDRLLYRCASDNMASRYYRSEESHCYSRYGARTRRGSDSFLHDSDARDGAYYSSWRLSSERRSTEELNRTKVTK